MLKMLFDWKYNSWLFAVVLLVCFLVSVGVRYNQFETWKKTPAAFFVGERPMMTTLDAPFWLRLAREYNEGTYRQKEDLRNYPDSTETFKKRSFSQKYKDPFTSKLSTNDTLSSSSKTPEFSYREVPLLSFLIAHLSLFFNYNYYLTGTLIIPVLASLFILPLGIYFYKIGVPLSGLMGGLVGTFASGYFMRSSIGRIDTDMLNLFFPVLAAFLILQASRAKSERSILLYSTVTGLSLFLFQWWYGKAAFILAYFMILIFSFFVHKIRFRTILLSSLLFILCAHPGTFMRGTDSVHEQLLRYFVIEEVVSSDEIGNETTPASFPNTMVTISEVDHVAMNEVLRRVLSNTMFDWGGILGIFGLAVLRWRELLPLFPMLALGLLSFQSSNRFIMYLGPFIGIGLGWLLNLGIEGVFHFLSQINQDSTDKRIVVARDIKDAKGKELKSFKVSKLLSSTESKDEGHLWFKIVSWLRIGVKTRENDNHNRDTKFKDGSEVSSQRLGLKSEWLYWVRQGTLYLGMGVFFWVISSQTAVSFVPGPSIHPRLYATFLEVKKSVPDNSALLTWWDYGYAITDVTGLATFHDGGGQLSPKTYFTARGLISSDQDELYDITQYLATEGNQGISENNISPKALMAAVRNPEHKPWDPIHLFFTADMTGKYGAISKLGSWDIEKGGSKPRVYQYLACNKITNEQMNCRGANINLKDGFINNQLALRRLIFIRNGQVFREQKFRHNQGFTLQLIVAGNNIVEVQLIDEAVFNSNYNQMFLLGRYREDLFEETYNAFPFSRLYRLKF